MGFKPNYQFERKERERAKAAKKEARLQAKREKTGTIPEGEEAPESGPSNSDEPKAE